MHPQAFGQIEIQAGATAQALSTTAAKLINFTHNGPISTNAAAGDSSVKPDYANNRILVAAPGVYKVEVVLSGDIDSSAELILQLYKNGSAYTPLKTKNYVTTNKGQIVLSGLVKVLESDAPGTIATFADPATTGFAGAGGAPKTLTALELYLAASTGTPSITLEQANFYVERVQ